MPASREPCSSRQLSIFKSRSAIKELSSLTMEQRRQSMHPSVLGLSTLQPEHMITSLIPRKLDKFGQNQEEVTLPYHEAKATKHIPPTMHPSVLGTRFQAIVRLTDTSAPATRPYRKSMEAFSAMEGFWHHLLFQETNNK